MKQGCRGGGFWGPASRWSLKGSKKKKKKERKQREGSEKKGNKKEKKQEGKSTWQRGVLQGRKLQGCQIDGWGCKGIILELCSRVPKLMTHCPPPPGVATSWIHLYKKMTMWNYCQIWVSHVRHKKKKKKNLKTSPFLQAWYSPILHFKS